MSSRSWAGYRKYGMPRSAATWLISKMPTPAYSAARASVNSWFKYFIRALSPARRFIPVRRAWRATSERTRFVSSASSSICKRSSSSSRTCRFLEATYSVMTCHEISLSPRFAIRGPLRGAHSRDRPTGGSAAILGKGAGAQAIPHVIPKAPNSTKYLTPGMNVRTVRVSEKGQIAIPAKIRRSLGLRKGSTLLLMEDKGRLLVTKAERVGDILVDDFSDLTKHAEATFRELWQNRPDEVWDDV